MHVDSIASSYQVTVPAVDSGRSQEALPRPQQDAADFVPVHVPSLKDIGNDKAQQKDEQARKTEEIFKKVNERINELVQSFQRHLHFEIHDKTGIMFVRVMDAREGKVLRELPMKEVLDTLARIQEAVGLFMDNKA